MRKNTKKILASLTAAGMILSCGSAFAADTPAFDLSGSPVIQTPESQEPAAAHNGGTFNVQAIERDGALTVPLREVMGQMGYAVAWNDETQGIDCVRDETVVGMVIGDLRYYHYNKMAAYNSSAMPYTELSAAPYLYQDSVTYVPLEMLTSVLGVSVYIGEENVVTIAEPANVTLNSVQADDDGIYLSVNDPKRGEVIVRFSDTIVIPEDYDLTALPEGAELEIEYGLAMTMSIPPQTTAIKIIPPAIETADDSVPGTIVKFKSLESDEDGQYIIVEDEVHGDVIARITDETKISGIVLSDLAEGNTISVEYGPAMTMSIPPQTTAVSVGLPYVETIDSAEFSGTITEQNIEAGQIVIDENGTARALNVDDGTKITHGLDKRVYKIDDLTVGTKITGVRETAETRSIPPQSYAISIEISG